ncbi:hypothetical protein ACFV0D_29140, partial [Streptomyces sp. NPDC059556]
MRTRTRTPLRTLVGLVAGATLALAPQAAALPAAPHPASYTGETPARGGGGGGGGARARARGGGVARARA